MRGIRVHQIACLGLRRQNQSSRKMDFTPSRLILCENYIQIGVDNVCRSRTTGPCSSSAGRSTSQEGHWLYAIFTACALCSSRAARSVPSAPSLCRSTACASATMTVCSASPMRNLPCTPERVMNASVKFVMCIQLGDTCGKKFNTLFCVRNRQGGVYFTRGSFGGWGVL